MSRILVVDDNPVSRELIRELLEAPGREILEASSGIEALASSRRNMPDLVLLDIQMPLMDGFAVLRAMRQEPLLARVRVMAVTAFAMRGDRQLALDAGFDDYITKPVDGAALRKQVQALLGAPSE
ncbi:MAG TPA: response regulator [Bryobacteraceae bacterium]|nr:response regulator [Bryobacteraceae bacterium]